AFVVIHPSARYVVTSGSLPIQLPVNISQARIDRDQTVTRRINRRSQIDFRPSRRGDRRRPLTIHDQTLLLVRDLSSEYTLVRHTAAAAIVVTIGTGIIRVGLTSRSEEHTSELQSHLNLVCRLLLEKKKDSSHTPYADQPD